MHVARPFSIVGHAVPQAPQFAGSVRRSTQAPLQLVRSAGQLPVQMTPVPMAFALQKGVVPMHRVVHAPQALATSSRVSQPFTALPSQSP